MTPVPPAVVVLEAAAPAPTLELACHTDGYRIAISVINRVPRSVPTTFDLVVTSSSGNVVRHKGTVPARTPHDLIVSEASVVASSFQAVTLRTEDGSQSRSSCDPS